MFVVDESVGPLRVAFTDRHGGTSAGPWTSLNLGAGGGDAPQTVDVNLHRVAAALGVDRGHLVVMRQVHGAGVVTVDHVPSTSPQCDALVTRTPGLVLMARAADCLPVVVADPTTGVAGVAHAGRRGLVALVVPALVAAARQLGASAALRAWIGPGVCGRCYEVPDAMRSEVADIEPAAWATTSWGTPALDLPAGVRRQLERLTVPVTDLADAVGPEAACTVESVDLFSYRRQGERSGRHAGLVHVRG